MIGDYLLSSRQAIGSSGWRDVHEQVEVVILVQKIYKLRPGRNQVKADTQLPECIMKSLLMMTCMSGWFIWLQGHCRRRKMKHFKPEDILLHAPQWNRGKSLMLDWKNMSKWKSKKQALINAIEESDETQQPTFCCSLYSFKFYCLRLAPAAMIVCSRFSISKVTSEAFLLAAKSDLSQMSLNSFYAGLSVKLPLVIVTPTCFVDTIKA